jgi:hypothetical protein
MVGTAIGDLAIGDLMIDDRQSVATSPDRPIADRT